MFHSALWKLTRLRWRGNFRQFCRSLKTVRGVIHFVFMAAMMCWGFGSMVVFGRMSAYAPASSIAMIDRIQEFTTIGLFVFTMWTILFSTGEATVFFSASEVAFLFPAPFSRQQLLTYRLLQSLSGIIFLSVLMSLMFARSPGLWLSGFFGMALTLMFLQLLAMNVAFLRQVVEARSSTLVRRIIGYSVLALMLTAVLQVLMTTPDGSFTVLVSSFRGSAAGRWLLAPFEAFTRMLFPGDMTTWLISAGPILLLDLLLLAAAYRLDGLSLEAAVSISEKYTARIKRMQSKGVWQAFGSPTSLVAGRQLPQLPFWNGIGPIVWQRLTTNMRTSRKLLVILGGAVLVAGGTAFGIFRRSPSEPFAAAGAATGVMFYVSFLISLSMPNEIERVGYLKSLPLRPVSIVLGELMGFVVLLSCVQGAFFLALCGLLPSISGWLFCAAVLSLPLNFLLFGIDKLVFYFFPTRMAKGAPGDFQNAGKQMVFMFLKMFALFASLLVVGLAIIPGALFGSPVLAVIPAVFVLLAECVGLIPLLSLAFRRFDASVDTPP